ncbi:tyrosine-type recombinase/integrase [Chloroflexota bacterium]
MGSLYNVFDAREVVANIKPRINIGYHKCRVQEANAKYFGWQLSGDDFVFTREDGTLPDPGYVSKVSRRIVKNAGLKRIRLHDLRHTYATLQRKAGQPIEVISRVLGHASEMVTLTIYNHWEGELRTAADTMDLMLEKISQNENKEAFVRNPLEDDERSECRPYRSRTCDTLIKRYRRIVPPSE